MNHQDLEDFKKRVGFSNVPGGSSAEGVHADWTTLASFLSAELKGFKLAHSQVIGLTPGLGQSSWAWRRGSEALIVEVSISGDGPARAREKLLFDVSSTMRTKIAYERGPADLGELSLQNPQPPVRTLRWVFRNACVMVSNSGTAVPVETVARTIQRFMQTHLVRRVADYLPRVDGVDVSPAIIHVGEDLRINVRIAAGVPGDSVTTDFEQVGERRFEAVDIERLTASYRAKQSGAARIDVKIVDLRTLLSPVLRVSVDVLPAVPAAH